MTTVHQQTAEPGPAAAPRRRHHPRSLPDVAERLAPLGVTYATLRGGVRRGEIATDRLAGIERIPIGEERRIAALLSTEE
jgi:hypothetical protein